jgi:hypothetical protein
MLTQGEGPEGSEMDLQLFRKLLQGYITQPATAIFRVIELPALIGHGIQQGLKVDIGCGDGKLTDIPANPTDWQARPVCSA